MEPWYEKFGWSEDPFSVRPSEKLVGLNKETNEILNYIYSGAIILVTGPTGCGKTSVLLWLERVLQKSYYTPVRINCVEKNTRESIYTEIKRSRNIRDRFSLKNFPKKPVLLLDEAQYLQKATGELIKIWWDDKRVYAVVLASIKDTLENLTGSFTDRFKGQTIYLPFLTSDLISDLVDLRTSKKNPFDDTALEAITIRSERIPRRALEICRKVCMACAEREIFRINKNHIATFVPLIREIRLVSPTIETQKRQETETKKTIMVAERQETETKKMIKERLGIFSLSPAQSEIVKFLKREELNAEQLATLLETSVGSIRKQLSRLKEKNIVTIANFEKSPITYKLSENYTRGGVKE